MVNFKTLVSIKETEKMTEISVRLWWLHFVYACINITNSFSFSSYNLPFHTVFRSRAITNITEQAGGSYFPYILLHEIQTMVSQLARRSARPLRADLCTGHAHYVKNHISTVLRRNKNMVVQGGNISHYYCGALAREARAAEHHG